MQVIVDAIDSEGEFINGQMLSARVISPDPSAKVKNVTLHQVGPGRYAGGFDAKVSRTSYQIGIVDEQKDSVVDSVGAALSYPPEYRDIEPDLGLLQQLADITHSRFIPGDLAGSFKHKERLVSALRSIWVPLLVVGVALLVVDVASRRLVLPDFLAARRERLKRGVGDRADKVMTRLRESRDQTRRRQERMEDLPISETLLKRRGEPTTAAPRGAIPADDGVVKLKLAKSKPGEDSAPPSATEGLMAAKRRAQRRTKGFSDDA